MLAYLLVAMFLGGFCMVANRLAATILTAPMVFLGLGAMMAQLDIVPSQGSEAALHLVADRKRHV